MLTARTGLCSQPGLASFTDGLSQLPPSQPQSSSHQLRVEGGVQVDILPGFDVEQEESVGDEGGVEALGLQVPLLQLVGTCTT